MLSLPGNQMIKLLFKDILELEAQIINNTFVIVALVKKVSSFTLV